MTRKSLTFVAVAVLVAAVIPAAAAQPDFSSVDLDTPGTNRVLELPDAAVPQGVPLGTAIDPQSGQLVEGYAIFHHRSGHNGGRGGGGPGGGDEGAETSTCFALFSKGAGWVSPEPWVVNPANSQGLDHTFVLNNLGNDMVKWETEAGSEIFGNGSIASSELEADTSAPDGENEVYFADIANPGAIAVTIVWGVFNGPPPFRSIVEWDMVFDQVDFTWSSTLAEDAMDFENIATHEVGHAAGLAHPSDSCTEETMFRFADEGEIKKRSLNPGDIAGIQDLY